MVRHKLLLRKNTKTWTEGFCIKYYVTRILYTHDYINLYVKFIIIDPRPNTFYNVNEHLMGTSIPSVL